EAKTSETILGLVNAGRAVLVCPEVAGGLPIPRPAAEIVDGDGTDVLAGLARVINEAGDDVTENYLAGARKAADAARGAGARFAILKARSPSCGCGQIHGGGFDGELRPGNGVTAALLRSEGVEVVSDEDAGDRPMISRLGGRLGSESSA
ncbi:MAG TPA: DUF523 domain-containing protein, partial [Actinomycetota bacterium]|nr:DUF523 domain-containing protein [Actinomycetota bacterium]